MSFPRNSSEIFILEIIFIPIAVGIFYVPSILVGTYVLCKLILFAPPLVWSSHVIRVNLHICFIMFFLILLWPFVYVLSSCRAELSKLARPIRSIALGRWSSQKKILAIQKSALLTYRHEREYEFGNFQLHLVDPLRVIFVSHKWYGDEPKDPEGKFLSWLIFQLQSLEHHVQDYVWIDFLCVNPKQPNMKEIANVISQLSKMKTIVWVAPGYENSAWCQLEALIAYESGRTDRFNINTSPKEPLFLNKQTDLKIFVNCALTAITLVGNDDIHGRFRTSVLKLLKRLNIRFVSDHWKRLKILDRY